MNRETNLARLPVLPPPLALPFRLIPSAVHHGVLIGVLNRICAPELEEGELDFLNDRVMLIRVRDAGLDYRITLANGHLKAAEPGRSHDLSIQGTLYDFLLLASRREDTDTLFFNRRLRVEGDTELGLYVKNFLDALELEDRLGHFQTLLDRAAAVIGRFA